MTGPDRIDDEYAAPAIEARTEVAAPLNTVTGSISRPPPGATTPAWRRPEID